MRRTAIRRSIAAVKNAHSAFVFAVVSCLLLGVARGEVRPSDVSHPVEPGADFDELRRTHFELHLTGHFGTVLTKDALTIAQLLTIVQPVGRNEVIFQWGMGNFQINDFVDAEAGDDSGKKTLSTFSLGNPHLAWLFAWRVPHRWIRAGFGIAAPAANIRDEEVLEGFIDSLSYQALWGVHGGRDIWLWAPETLSGVLHADITFRFEMGVTVGIGVHAAEMYAIDGDRDGELDTAAQGDLDLAYEHPSFRAGVLATYATRITGDGTQDEKDNIGVTPELRLRLPRMVDLVARFNLNIDEPLGFSFDDDRYWGATLGVSSSTTPRLPKPVRRRRFK